MDLYKCKELLRFLSFVWYNFGKVSSLAFSSKEMRVLHSNLLTVSFDVRVTLLREALCLIFFTEFAFYNVPLIDSKI